MLLKISRFWEEIRYLIKLHWSPQGWQWKRIPRSGLVGSLRDPSCSQSCPTLWDPVDYSSPGSSVHGDSPGKILKRVARPSSRGFTQPRDRTQVSHIAGGFFTVWATRGTWEYWSGLPCPPPGDLPDTGIKPRSPTLQADSLLSESPGKPTFYLCII